MPWKLGSRLEHLLQQELTFVISRSVIKQPYHHHQLLQTDTDTDRKTDTSTRLLEASWHWYRPKQLAWVSTVSQSNRTSPSPLDFAIARTLPLQRPRDVRRKLLDEATQDAVRELKPDAQATSPAGVPQYWSKNGRQFLTRNSYAVWRVYSTTVVRLSVRM